MAGVYHENIVLVGFHIGVVVDVHTGFCSQVGIGSSVFNGGYIVIIVDSHSILRQ